MKKILVIEDEQDVRESILDILNSEDFYAIGAANGKVGLEIATEFQPNLILCDVMMPILDGYGVLTQLKQELKTQTIPFVFLTAKADKTDFRQGMALGADDYLTKPFTYDELLQAITTRLEKQGVVEQHSQQRLDALRQNISYALPYEMNTALMVIGGMATILKQEHQSATPPEILDIANALGDATQRLQRLIQHFLLMAQLEVLATNPNRSKELQNYKTEDAGWFIESVSRYKAEEYHRETDLHLDLTSTSVMIASENLTKIVEELLDNAFKFSQEGSSVKICSACVDSSFVLHVIDSGHGMTAEQISSIGAYMQFDRSLYEQQGTGLGLAIVKRMVELHNGRFAIESIPEQQTIVRISLPLSSAIA